VRAVLETAAIAVERGRARGAGNGGNYPGGLTDREVEVLRLVSRGLSDRQVATELGLATGEVSRHLQFAYEKIGVTTRAAAAMFAMRNGLVGGV
jgi:DNA-binding NarL/FixJ family response regulator